MLCLQQCIAAFNASLPRRFQPVGYALLIAYQRATKEEPAQRTLARRRRYGSPTPGAESVFIGRNVRATLAFWHLDTSYDSTLSLSTWHIEPVSYTHLRAHETRHDLVC